MPSVSSAVWAFLGLLIGVISTWLILSGKIAHSRYSSKQLREEGVKAKVDCDEWQVKAEYFEAVNKNLSGISVERDLFKSKFLEIDEKFSRRSSPRKNGKFSKIAPDERVAENVR